VVDLDADAYVSMNAGVPLGWRIENRPIQIVGAQFLASDSTVTRIRHGMAVLDVPAGHRRIQPSGRPGGRPGTSGILGARCLTAEAYTS